MKMVMLIYSGSAPERMRALLETHGASGYTMWSGAMGAGETGRREGTRAWPGESWVAFTFVPEERVSPFTDALRQESERLDPGDRLHIAVLPTEAFF